MPNPKSQLNLPSNGTICLYVVRHGQTELNQSNCFRGNANPSLDKVGFQQAKELSKLFENIDISHIFSSDKLRAQQTAKEVSKGDGIPVHTTESLRALNVGKFSGQKRTPEAESELQNYLESPNTTIPEGESLNNFKSRIAPCLQEAIDIFCECGIPPLLVAHSSVVHEVGALVHNDHKSVLVEPGGIVAVYFDGKKLSAKPIFKPVKASGTQAETIT